MGVLKGTAIYEEFGPYKIGDFVQLARWEKSTLSPTIPGIDPQQIYIVADRRQVEDADEMVFNEIRLKGFDDQEEHWHDCANFTLIKEAAATVH